MFIECYRIPKNDWGKKDSEIRKKENLVLIHLNRIDFVQSSRQNTNRAEILLSTDKRVHVLGSYEEVLSRIENLGETNNILNRIT